MTELESMLAIADVQKNKAFMRLQEKTQVVEPKNGRIETVMNRFSHSYEVANSSCIMSKSMKIPGLNIDYQNSLFIVSLLHDIGHPPFGHSGADLLDEFVKSEGVSEGFSDNSNNFVVIKKNQIKLDDYSLSSLIKYPSKLYPNHKEELCRILEYSIDQDVRYFGKKIKIDSRPKRTIACEIMDEADRNSYVASDLTDFYSLKLGNHDELQKLMDENSFSDHDINAFLVLAIKAVKEHDKSLIKKAFSNLKNMFNLNYYIGNNLILQPKNEELIELREKLFKIEKKFFINSEEVLSQRDLHMEYLKSYINWVKEGNYPSKTYRRLIENASSHEEKVILMRDMIAETTDWYIFNFAKQC